MKGWLAAISRNSLGYIRIGIGCLLLLRTTPLLLPLDIPWLRSAFPLLGWPSGGFNLSFLPPNVIMALCIVRTLAAVLFTLGIGARAAGIVCGATGLLVAAQYPLGFFFTIHLLYQAAILLAFTDAATELSLGPAQGRGPSDGLWLIRAFVASIYFWAGIYKLRPDWLDGRTLALFHDPTGLRGWPADFLFSREWLPALAAKFVAGLELSLGPLLLCKRTRRVALVIAYAFHLTLEISAHPDMLGWGMLILLLSFLPERRGPGLGARDVAAA